MGKFLHRPKPLRHTRDIQVYPLHLPLHPFRRLRHRLQLRHRRPRLCSRRLHRRRTHNHNVDIGYLLLTALLRIPDRYMSSPFLHQIRIHNKDIYLHP